MTEFVQEVHVGNCWIVDLDEIGIAIQCNCLTCCSSIEIFRGVGRITSVERERLVHCNVATVNRRAENDENDRARISGVAKVV